MKVCITAQAAGLEAPVEPRFARAPFFVFIDTITGEIHSVANALCTGHGGVGPRVVQFIAEYGAEALVTGRLGENADRRSGRPTSRCMRSPGDDRGRGARSVPSL